MAEREREPFTTSARLVDTIAAAIPAAARATVRIVPSIGFSTAWYAAAEAAASASATRAPVASPASRSVPVRPRRIWLRMTPLLPRAPMSDPWLIASHVGPRPGSPAGSPSTRPAWPTWASRSSSSTTASSVRAMFVPVSPSGTG